MSEPKIFSAICAIMSECGAIGKDRRNSQQNFNFRGIDDVMNAMHPLLAQHGVFVVPEVIESTRDERTTAKGAGLIYSILKVRFTFYAADGSSVAAVVQGEGMDNGDKASNKAMSAAFKYALFQVFCIPTEEMTDPDAETPEPSKPAEYLCASCGKPFAPFEYEGRNYTARDAYMNAQRRNPDGKARCKTCREKLAK